ncbi:MAG: hypothetical protein IJX63_09710 [Lachnospiraceae bacterium]|nr:hypothetical protein [Lachnospiraceae bacterium]
MSKEKSDKRSIWPGTILVAFAAAIGTFFLLLHMEKNALNAYEKEAVWITTVELAKGLEITEATWKECFEQVEVDKNRVPQGVINNPQELVGTLTEISIPKGCMVMNTMFSNEKEYIEGLYSPVIAGCKADDVYQIVSGVLRKGDIVNMYTVNEELGETYLLWEKIMVYQTFDASGNSIAPEDTTTPAARVNLLLEEGYAEQFYNELNQGSLRMVKIWE